MEKKQGIVSDVILNNSNQETTSENSPLATRPRECSPSDSSISSCRSSPSHGDGSERSLHPSPPPPIIYHPPDEPATSVNRSVRNEPVPLKKAYRAAVEHGFLAVEEGGGRGVSVSGTRRPKTTSWTRTRSEGAVKKAALVFRVFGFMFCLISFSVMAADRRKGWALDSFYRYIEFRYCLTVNVIGFVYSASQGLNLAYQLSSGKLVSGSHLRYVFDFALDQMLAYLLISSSSSAAIRADDWKSNWGKDNFPDMASASVAVSFIAFVSLASSSLISGYILCTL